MNLNQAISKMKQRTGCITLRIVLVWTVIFLLLVVVSITSKAISSSGSIGASRDYLVKWATPRFDDMDALSVTFCTILVCTTTIVLQAVISYDSELFLKCS